MHLFKWKLLNFEWYFIEMCSLGSTWQYIIIGSDNGLAPNRRQAIIWTNDSLVNWHICATRPQWVSFSVMEIKYFDLVHTNKIVQHYCYLQWLCTGDTMPLKYGRIFTMGYCTCHDFQWSTWFQLQNFTTWLLTHWGRDKMTPIFSKTFSNAFSWMKIYEFWLKFHWSLFLRVQLIKFQHWFR